MLNERDLLVAEISSLDRQIKVLAFELNPVWQRDRKLRDQIAATHGGPGKFNARRALARKPLFEGLTEIAVQYGPKKQIAADLKRRLTAYTKQVQRLDKERKR